MKTKNENEAFKKDLETKIIPSIKRMIKKESDHLKWLTKNKVPEKMKEVSKNRLFHYKKRLTEYNEYFKTL